MIGKINTIFGRVALIAGLALSAAAQAQAAATRFALPAQPLADSLRAVGTQTNTNVLFDPGVVEALRAPEMRADLTRDEALELLLMGTGLTFELLSERTAVVAPIREPRAPVYTKTAASIVTLAQVDPSSRSSTAPSESANGGNGGAYSRNQPEEVTQEVLVTAQKRSERLQEVPVPVTAVNATALIESNQTRLQDFYTRIPGLSVMPGDPARGGAVLTIRGVTTGGFENPTVGIVVDDVPYGSSTSLGGGLMAPDIDPSDLAQVEVLRGPQGTLYGASSIGGLLKFVTIDPSSVSLSGRLQGGVTSVQNGDGMGYNIRGAVNVPLGDTLAVRASGFTRRDPGYIDDPALGAKGVNQGDFDGGRLSALWKPSDNISLKVSALLQDGETKGAPYVYLGPGFGDLEQSNILQGLGGYDKSTDVYSANLTSKLGPVNLTAVSGYSINKFSDSLDRTAGLGLLTQAVAGVNGTEYFESYKTTKFTQEIRASTPIGEKFEWLMGLFYTDEDSRSSVDLIAIDAATNAAVTVPYHNPTPTTYSEYAAFTDFTYHVTDRFDIQLGGRESQNRQKYSSSFTGSFIPLFFGLPEPLIYPEVKSKDNAFTYLVTPRFKLSSDVMLYARLASGYRAGGPNSNCLALGVPCQYKPDTTENYEIGVKGEALNRTLSYDASVYYIDWKDIQLSLVDPATFFLYYANAGRAKSQGVELSATSRPLTGLSVSAWVAWNDAELSAALPAAASAVGQAGDRLPFSSRFSGNLSLDQEFFVTNGVTGFIGSSMSYVGDRASTFPAAPPRQMFPSYTQVDLRAGTRFESWTASLYVNNLTDKRVALSGGLGTINPIAFNVIQPRTAGLTVTKSF